MVKDELDVLPYTLAHLQSEGVTGIIVADNLSTDGTWEWLQELRLDCELIVQRDDEVGYYQSTKMSALADQARRLGAKWVLPFDADELWHNAAAGLTLAQTLLTSDSDCHQARLHNYFTTDDDPPEPNPFLRIRFRDPTPGALPKVLVRAYPGLVIAQGNHGAHSRHMANYTWSSIEVAHFPWRSPEQFERKVANGYAAYQAAALPADMGAHWRQYGEILLHQGPEALREVYDTWFHDPALRLEYRPAPWCRAIGLSKGHIPQP